MSKTTSAKVNLAISAIIFGTLGLFSKNISMPATVITMIRGLVAAPFLLLVLRIQGKRLSWDCLKKNLIPLFLSGISLAIAMITLFESYKYLTVAAASIFYAMAPVIFVAVAPFLFRESMNLKKILCIITAVVGVYLVSNLLETGLPTSLEEAKGILLGIACAISYALVTIINKKICGVPAFDKTIVQLAIFGIVLLPVNIFTGSFSQVELSSVTIINTVIVCIVHTGIAFLCYFGPLEYLPANTSAIIFYLEPVTAVLMSAFVLHEPLNAMNILGVVLVLGAAVCNEINLKKPTKPIKPTSQKN